MLKKWQNAQPDSANGHDDRKFEHLEQQVWTDLQASDLYFGIRNDIEPGLYDKNPKIANDSIHQSWDYLLLVATNRHGPPRCTDC